MKTRKDVNREFDTSFGDVIRAYQRLGHPTRESIELAYSKEYREKTKKTVKKISDKVEL